jgi:hypothetical protein
MTNGHGDEAGYRRHLRNGEPACGHCLWGHRQFNKQKAIQRKNRELRQTVIKPIRPPAPTQKVVLHGTPQALRVHSIERSPVCRICLDSVVDWEHREATRYLNRLRGAA